jgi:hypothetical protein
MLISIVGGLLAIIGSLIIVNLSSIKKHLYAINARLDNQDSRITHLDNRFSQCKIDCDRNTVSKEDWVRSEAFTRDKLDKLAATLNRMDGKLDIVEKIPQIAGSIAREIASQLNRTGG